MATKAGREDEERKIAPEALPEKPLFRGRPHAEAPGQGGSRFEAPGQGELFAEGGYFAVETLGPKSALFDQGFGFVQLFEALAEFGLGGGDGGAPFPVFAFGPGDGGGLFGLEALEFGLVGGGDLFPAVCSASSSSWSATTLCWEACRLWFAVCAQVLAALSSAMV
jgi:hypothetical protein